jgi:hypothetical protein
MPELVGQDIASCQAAVLIGDATKSQQLTAARAWEADNLHLLNLLRVHRAYWSERDGSALISNCDGRDILSWCAKVDAALSQSEVSDE